MTAAAVSGHLQRYQLPTAAGKEAGEDLGKGSFLE